MSERKWSEIFALFSTGEVLLGQPPGSGEENDGFWGGGPKRGGSGGGTPGGGGKNATSAHIVCAGNPPIYTVFKARFSTLFTPPPPPPYFFPQNCVLGKKIPDTANPACAEFAPPPELRQTGVSGKRMFDIADWNSDSVTQELLVYRYLNGWNYSIEYGAIEDGVYGRVS